MAMKIWIPEIFAKKVKMFGLSSAIDIHVEMIKLYYVLLQ